MPKNAPAQMGGGGLVKEKRGLVQEYSMLFKSLNRWLNESLKLMDSSKTTMPNEYIEIKVNNSILLFKIKILKGRNFNRLC
jgi:hypothetical protein